MILIDSDYFNIDLDSVISSAQLRVARKIITHCFYLSLLLRNLVTLIKKCIDCESSLREHPVFFGSSFTLREKPEKQRPEIRVLFAGYFERHVQLRTFKYHYKPSLGAVTLDLSPKAPHGEIAWVGVALGFDHFHVCCHIAINCPREKKLEPGLVGNVVVSIEG